MIKRTVILTYAHQTGLGTMLAQGQDTESAQPIAIVSNTTALEKLPLKLGTSGQN